MHFDTNKQMKSPRLTVDVVHILDKGALVSSWRFKFLFWDRSLAASIATVLLDFKMFETFSNVFGRFLGCLGVVRMERY